NSKSFYQKDELWQSAWGTEPSDSSDYFYLIWRISYTTASNCTQSYTISIDDIIPAEYMTKGAYVVGYRYNSSTASFVSGDSYYTAIVDAPLSSYNPTYYWYVVIAYPRSLYLDENLTSLTITNTAETELAGEYDTTVKTDKTTAAYNYSTVNFSYSGDIYSVSKSYYSSPVCNGLINALKDDQSVEIKSFPPAGYSFSIATTSRGYGETYGLLDTGEYGYGAKEYTTTLIDDLMYLEGEQLVAGDYSIDSFSMYTYGFIEYDAYENLSSGALEGKASTDYTSYSPIEVWYQSGGDGSSWILLGTVTKKSNSSCTFTPKGGTAQALNSSDDQVALPSGCTGIKFVHSTNRYSVSYQPRITVSLHSTDHVKLLLAGKSSAILYNIDSLIVENADGNMVNSSMSSIVPGTLNSLVDQRDENIYGNKVQHQNSYYNLNEITATSYITKTSSTPANDGANPQAKVTYTITAYDRATANGQLSWEYIKSLGVIVPQNEGTFYDLLPAGAYADTSSIQVKTYALDSGSTTTCTVESIETVDNWQGSGQTMLIINVCYPDADYGDNYYSSGNLYYSGFTLTYDLYYPWDSIVDYGNSLINSVAYRAAEGELSQGKTAAESDITYKEYFANLTDSTGSSPNDDMDKNTIYKDLTTSVIVATSTNVGFSKKVNSTENSLYDKSASVYIGDTYTYQLRYRTAEDANAKNIVFYDVLEENYGTNSYWKGTFAGIDTSYIASNYPDVDIQVYYSTVSGLDQYSASSPNLADLSIWSITPPTDLSTVTAVAVDISKNKDNTDFELQINSTVLCYITMTAPSDYSAYLAYNYAKCYGSMFTTPGNETTFALPSDSNVSLLAKTNFEFTKVDAVDDQVLSDAEFALYEWTDTTSPSVTDLVNQSSPGSWSLVDTAASDGNGLVTFTDLTEGYYQLVEISAPTGYVTPSGQWRIEVDATGAITFTAVKGPDGSAPPAFSGAGTTASPYKLSNIIDYKLPEMGGIGTYIFRILGGVLLLIGLAVTVIDSFRKRKSRVRE
ncbi:MAG: prealbumin-like fold domain-containing protein, partial [Lachnospiraceae bacterium]